MVKTVLTHAALWLTGTMISASLYQHSQAAEILDIDSARQIVIVELSDTEIDRLAKGDEAGIWLDDVETFVNCRILKMDDDNHEAKLKVISDKEMAVVDAKCAAIDCLDGDDEEYVENEGERKISVKVKVDEQMMHQQYDSRTRLAQSDASVSLMIGTGLTQSPLGGVSPFSEAVLSLFVKPNMELGLRATRWKPIRPWQFESQESQYYLSSQTNDHGANMDRFVSARPTRVETYEFITRHYGARVFYAQLGIGLRMTRLQYFNNLATTSPDGIELIAMNPTASLGLGARGSFGNGLAIGLGWFNASFAVGEPTFKRKDGKDAKHLQDERGRILPPEAKDRLMNGFYQFLMMNLAIEI